MDLVTRETSPFKRQIPPTPFSKGGVGVCLRSNIKSVKTFLKLAYNKTAFIVFASLLSTTAPLSAIYLKEV
jgi:hypothetical protein